MTDSIERKNVMRVLKLKILSTTAAALPREYAAKISAAICDLIVGDSAGGAFEFAKSE